MRGLPEGRFRIGISSCLLGEKVRYDGGDKLDRFLVDTLGKYVQHVPVCPEVECGLTVPREPMQLEGDPSSPRLVTINTHIDHTGRMLSWAGRRLAQLEGEDISGFIFKSRSPSCGVRDALVYPGGAPATTGAGLFVRALMERFPQLPVEDEERLHDPEIYEDFMKRAFAASGIKRTR